MLNTVKNINYLFIFTSSLTTDLYTPRCFFGHAALLRQAFAHCAKFPTAASRRSLGRISVPMWLIILSDQLLIAALVGHYPTNKLIRHKPILKREPKPSLIITIKIIILFSISLSFPRLSQSLRQVIYALLTRSPLYSSKQARSFSFDLHVLSTPPAFILSQDQTLHCKIFIYFFILYS